MRSDRIRGRSAIQPVIGIVIGLAVLLLILSIRVVDQGKVCAVVQLGSVTGQARTGLQFVTPLITRLDCYDRQVTIYQTGDVQNMDADYWDVPVEIKSSDGQTAYLSFNVTYHVDSENV